MIKNVKTVTVKVLIAGRRRLYLQLPEVRTQ